MFDFWQKESALLRVGSGRINIRLGSKDLLETGSLAYMASSSETIEIVSLDKKSCYTRVGSGQTKAG